MVCHHLFDMAQFLLELGVMTDEILPGLDVKPEIERIREGVVSHVMHLNWSWLSRSCLFKNETSAAFRSIEAIPDGLDARKEVATAEGLEPSTFGLEGRRSNPTELSGQSVDFVDEITNW